METSAFATLFLSTRFSVLLIQSTRVQSFATLSQRPWSFGEQTCREVMTSCTWPVQESLEPYWGTRPEVAMHRICHGLIQSVGADTWLHWAKSITAC